jgi:hypothetical protein
MSVNIKAPISPAEMSALSNRFNLSAARLPDDLRVRGFASPGLPGFAFFENISFMN